ncbi:XkdX family protein [Feifania hominis]|uniref:XkdX family protein n=1 Tax=Feifania hominis TaxID=2763660 RepID=A0A926HV26_9FIRM|nr:XkdX family protein [Feifania hominis]MBC8536898.1 XkdX family protein [Feifania hominis]
MEWFDKIQGYYDAGLWPPEWVIEAVAKEKITAEQADMILSSK